MIYLDSAATTLQKPRSVASAMAAAARSMASPGRGGHRPARLAAETAYECREALAGLFSVAGSENIVFTMNATHALNIALRSLVSPGGRAVVSGWEHNAVTRPLHMLGAEIDAVRTPLFDRDAALAGFAEKLPGAQCCVCTAVSNVFGFELPFYEIAGLCREAGVPFVLDASQAAGAMDIDASRLGAAFIAMPGHKGLLGPQGTGLLICSAGAKPLMAGGTGSESRSRLMPEYLPDRLEAGTHNMPGIAGLLAGMEFVKRLGIPAIARRERALTRALGERLSALPGLELFLSERPEAQAGVLSVRSGAMGCEELAEALARRGVCTRAGLHCAPLAHESAGTLESGTVRFSVSPFNTPQELKTAAGILARCLRAG